MNPEDRKEVEEIIDNKIKWALQIEQYDESAAFCDRNYRSTSYGELFNAIMNYLGVEFEIEEIPQERKTILKKKNTNEGDTKS